MNILGRPIHIEKKTDLDFVLPDAIKDILYWASLAPSSHNTQNWYVVVAHERNEMSVFLDTDRVLLVVDPDLREAHLSIGAFLENLRQAFVMYGYQVQVTLNDDKGQNLCAVVTYEKSSVSETGAHGAKVFYRRHSDKAVFKKTPVPEERVRVLLEKYGSCLRYFPAESGDGRYIAGTTLDAYVQQANNQAARDELSGWMRFSDREVLAAKDGLPAEQLGLSGIVKSLYYLTTSRESSRKDGFAKQGIGRFKTQIEGCGGFFLITGQEGKKSWVEAGMNLEAVWLDAVREDIAMQPISVALEERPYGDRIHEKYGERQCVHMILRAGLVESYGNNAGIRRQLKDFVKSSSY